MTEWLAEWWGLAVAILTAAVGFKGGQERNSWRIQSVEKDLENVKQTVAKNETDITDTKINGKVIGATLAQIKESQARIEKTLSEKEDRK